MNPKAALHASSTRSLRVRLRNAPPVCSTLNLTINPRNPKPRKKVAHHVSWIKSLLQKLKSAIAGAKTIRLKNPKAAVPVRSIRQLKSRKVAVLAALASSMTKRMKHPRHALPVCSMNQPKKSKIALAALILSLYQSTKAAILARSTSMNQQKSLKAVLPVSSTLNMKASLLVSKRAALPASFTLSHSAKMAFSSSSRFILRRSASPALSLLIRLT